MSRRPGVLFVGQNFYHPYYLSLGLRELGWRADVLNWDPNPAAQHHYHGQDFRFEYRGRSDVLRHGAFYARALRRYDVFHFSNAHGLRFGESLHAFASRFGGPGAEIRLLRRLGKKIVYSNNGCLDAVRQSSFARWGPHVVCEDCRWRNEPSVCSDERNAGWGEYRNSLADYQCLMGGNRADFNRDPRVHEVPQFYCMDPDVWSPDLEVPERHRIDLPASTVRIYHAVGDAATRSWGPESRNIKSTHLYVPVVEQLKREGHDCELLFFTDMPNLELRYVQVQADIVVDMLTFGFYGATTRESLMLGKPVVCYLRPAWLEQMRRELPGYVDELPVVSATPETVHDVLADLISNPAKRAEIGRRSREFALKWHSVDVGARRMDEIYRSLLDGTTEPAPRENTEPAPELAAAAPGSIT
jgi:hypothetical protein